MANQDEILGILGSIIGGATEGAINTQNLNKKLDHELEQDSLRQDYDLMKMELADSLTQESELERLAYKDSLDVKNQAYMDSVAQARLDDTQKHDMELNRLKTILGLFPAQASILTEQIDSDIGQLNQKYGAIKSKMQLRNQGVTNATQAPFDLANLKGVKLREFFDEKGGMWGGLDEGDIINSYKNAKEVDAKGRSLDALVNTAIHLPKTDKKRQSMVRLIDEMLEKVGVTYNSKGERQTNEMYDDFTDGDSMLPFGANDPGGLQAKAIIEELEMYKDMLSGGEESIDQIYEITPEERAFYDSHSSKVAGKKQQSIDLQIDLISKLLNSIPNP